MKYHLKNQKKVLMSAMSPLPLILLANGYFPKLQEAHNSHFTGAQTTRYEHNYISPLAPQMWFVRFVSAGVWKMGL